MDTRGARAHLFSFYWIIFMTVIILVEWKSEHEWWVFLFFFFLSFVHQSIRRCFSIWCIDNKSMNDIVSHSSDCCIKNIKFDYPYNVYTFNWKRKTKRRSILIIRNVYPMNWKYFLVPEMVTLDNKLNIKLCKTITKRENEHEMLSNKNWHKR